MSSPVGTSRTCPALWALPGQHRERVHLPGHFQDLSNPVGTSRTCTGKVSSPVGTSGTCPALWALPGAAQRACPSMWALPGPFHLPGRFQDLSSPMGIPGQSQGRGQLGGMVTQRWHVRNVTPGWLQQPGEQRGTAQAPQPHPLHKRWEIRAAPSCSRCPARPGMPAGMHPHTPNRCSRAGKGLTLTPGCSHKVKEKGKFLFPRNCPAEIRAGHLENPKPGANFIGKTQCPKPTWSIQDLKNCTEVLSAFLYEFPLPCVLLYSFGLTLIIHYYSQSWRSGLESQGCFGQAGPQIRFSPVLLSEFRSFGGCFLSAVLCLPPAWQCPKGEELLIILGRKSI